MPPPITAQKCLSVTPNFALNHALQPCMVTQSCLATLTMSCLSCKFILLHQRRATGRIRYSITALDSVCVRPEVVTLCQEICSKFVPRCVCAAVCVQLSLCGLGIIAPLSVAWSLVVGAVLSWGLLWPVLSTKEGSWFPSGELHTHNHGFFWLQHPPAVCNEAVIAPGRTQQPA